jgi:hypothetical protein
MKGLEKFINQVIHGDKIWVLPLHLTTKKKSMVVGWWIK